MRRERGFSLAELMVTMAVFGIFLLILVGLQREFMRFDKSMRLQFLRHPEMDAVMGRLRRDVLDSTGYPASFAGFEQSPSTLLLDESTSDGAPAIVVWTFGENTARRQQFEPGGAVTGQWQTRGIPPCKIGSYELPDGTVAVRLSARDDDGSLLVDEIAPPRAH